MSSAPVVVGVDGSASAWAAVEAAAREALLRDTELRVVHAFLWPAMHVPPGPSVLGPPSGGVQESVEALLAEATVRARRAAPGVVTRHAVIAGAAVGTLEAESRTAQLVVLGHRGTGGFAQLLLGSTAVQLAAHAHCPVLVVRGTEVRDGPVLVAVDGSPQGRGALSFAFAEASLRGAGLEALHAWTTWSDHGEMVPGSPVDVLEVLGDIDELRATEERLLAEALAGLRGHYPDVAVRPSLVRGRTRPVLIEASGRAQLVVVGARGHGGFTGLLLGSVSQALLHHAHCPVAVVRSGL
ncbi:universal stress protein [Streptomyces luteolus]|uniref:Universal stress protein n=1 Tax=Streptomyces luteolus TaxID=3043615 RepID=A0ABT6SV91_9ACTN|nr:universal stress protein [Streptomyces sp. B-S-A12]MDI3419140.1 universal stress protein [Streptomyces sp. B-S-A12]